MSLNAYIDPDNYHPEAVANAAAGDVESLPQHFLIVRLGLALRDGKLTEAEGTIRRLEKSGIVGYELFQLATAKLSVALRRNDQQAFQSALQAWLDGRRAYPQNWFNKVLDEPELEPWLASVDPQDLAPPPPIVAPALTADDLAYVKDLPGVRLAAIRENLQWLRELGLTETEEELAQGYQMFSVNRDLREVMLAGRPKDPPIIVAFDQNGTFAGSFLAH